MSKPTDGIKAWRRVWLKADHHSRGGQQSRETAVCVLASTLSSGYHTLGLRLRPRSRPVVRKRIPRTPTPNV
jgi:hypothetical protein